MPNNCSIQPIVLERCEEGNSEGKLANELDNETIGESFKIIKQNDGSLKIISNDNSLLTVGHSFPIF